MVIKKIKPLNNHIVVTMERYGADELEGSLITKTSGTLKEFQKVIAVGPTVRHINEGDMVQVNPNRYAVRKYQENSIKNDLLTNDVVGYNIPQVEIDGVNYMYIFDSDIDFVIEEFDNEPKSSLIHVEPKIVLS